MSKQKMRATLQELASLLTPDEHAALREKIAVIAERTSEREMAILELEGSAHRDCSWYKGPPVTGTKQKLLDALDELGLEEIALDESCPVGKSVSIRTGTAYGLNQETLKLLLVQAGLPADQVGRLFQLATTETPWRSVIINGRVR